MAVAIVLAAATTAAAQVKVGVKAGMNVASMGDVPLRETSCGLDNQTGFHAGVMLEWLSKSRWGIETGLYYSMKGGGEKELDRNEQYEVKATAHYLQMPVQALYQFNLSEDWSLYPAAGLYVAYGLSGKLEGSGKDVEEHGQEFDLTYSGDFFGENMKRLDVGLLLGARLQYKQFLLGIGYEMGFLRLNKRSIPYEDDQTRNENLTLSVGVLF
jgi:hypothetical protein